MNKSSSKVLVIGELNADLIAGGLIAEPTLGQEIIAEDFKMTLGSASAIFACGISKLANEVTFVSRVGQDVFGEFCLKFLAENGVSTKFVEEKENLKTGVTLVLSTRCDRALVTYLGAIASLSLADIVPEVFDSQQHLHLTSYFLQHGLRTDFPHLIKEAKRRNLTVSFDPNSDPSQDWNEEIFEVIKLADILFLNEIEAKQLTLENDLAKAAVRLGEFCQCVVIKLGAKGALGYQDGKLEQIGGFSVNAIDTTGAGDSFAAGFVHAFLKGADLPECLQTGNACGALSTRQMGGTSAQPNLSQLEEFLAKAGRPAFAGS